MKHNKKLKITLLIPLIVVLLVIGFILNKYVFNSKPIHYTETAKTTSTAPSAQSDFPGGDKPLPDQTPSSTTTTTDNNGVINQEVPPSQDWSHSKDGTSVIVYSPAANNTIPKTGTIFGQAASATVSYRITDDVTGVISQGIANVVSGKFSINYSLQTTAVSGDIEVFNQKDSNSPESNNVFIPVRFK